MNRITRLACAASAFVLPATMAVASTSISYTSTFGPTSTEFTANGSLNAFNAALGTLTSVTITYDIAADMVGTVTSTANGTNNFKFTESVEADYTFTGSYDNSAVDGFGNPLVPASVTASKTQNYNGFTKNQSGSYGEYTYAMTDTSSSMSFTGDLSAFVNNSLNYSMTTVTGQNVQGGGGNMSASINTAAQGYVKITYFYDAAVAAVPEPATWAMMVGGFGILGGALRRTRRTTVAFG